MIHPNIFKPRNDWNVRSLNCRNGIYKGVKTEYFEKCVAKEIKMVYGVDIYESTAFRNRELVEARQIFMSLMVKHTKRSQASIGRLIGKDHATVIHAVKTTQNLCDTDKRFREMYDIIDNRIKQLN